MLVAIHLMRNVTKILTHHASEAIKSFNEKHFRLMYDLFSVLLGEQFVKQIDAKYVTFLYNKLYLLYHLVGWEKIRKSFDDLKDG